MPHGAGAGRRPAMSAKKAAGIDFEAARSHWAYQPIRQPAIPAVKDAGWPSTPIDSFVLARLEAAGLTPSPPADRRTLLRRVYFDLIGLPPTAEEIEAFEKDRRPDAYVAVGRPPAGLAALRRTLGPALARRRPIRRHQGRRADVRRRPRAAVRLHLSRLRHPGVQ